MKKVILFLVLLLTLCVVLGLAGCTTPPLTLTYTYAVGDTGPAGGWIFYDKGSYSDGWRYLEAAPSDQSTEIQWYNGSYVVTGATDTAIGTGQANTTAIVAIQGAGSYAAQLCNDLIVGFHSDWFLPSKDELAAMRTNLASTVADRAKYGFAYSYYWSSSEIFAFYAWNQAFLDGGQYYGSKGDTGLVRAVRAF